MTQTDDEKAREIAFDAWIEQGGLDAGRFMDNLAAAIAAARAEGYRRGMEEAAKVAREFVKMEASPALGMYGVGFPSQEEIAAAIEAKAKEAGN